VKPRLASTDGDASAVHAVLAYCFDVSLRLLHPIVPFITEELWQKLPGRAAGELLAMAKWPDFEQRHVDVKASFLFPRVQEAIAAIRNIRAEYKVSPKYRLKATWSARTPEMESIFSAERETILRLAQLSDLAPKGAAFGPGAHAVLQDGSEIFVALEGTIDVRQECRRLSEELGRLDNQLKGLTARLTNESFVSRAPQDVVAREREKEKAWRDQRDVLAGKLKSLGCS